MWLVQLLFISLPLFNQSQGFDKASTNLDTFKINQIQIIGSHNSYRIKNDTLWNELNRWKHPFTKMMVTKSWNYSHLPLDTQLTKYGLRSLELDVYYDPNGGRYYNQKGNKKIKKSVSSNVEDLKKPGLKVMHVPDYDYKTHHYLFKDALQTIKKWSDKNPNHEPLFIMVEMKDLQFMKYFFPFKNTKTLPFDEQAVESIDKEIEEVFGSNSNQIIIPDSLRKSNATLRESILKNGWPTLNECKGKIFFILMGSKKGMKNYLKGHENLSGRKMFVFADENDLNAAFIKIGNPLKNFSKIQKLVKQGFIVRTRTDAGGREARKENYERSKAAFDSGAQIISTDFYSGRDYYFKKKHNNFKIALPDKHVYRLNPVSLDSLFISK